MNVAGPYSVAGQWGSERKQPLPVLNTSSSREDYGVHNKRELERASRNPFARFKGIKDSNPIILTYNNRPTHMDSLHDEGMKDIDPLMTTTARAMNVCKKSFDFGMSDGLTPFWAFTINLQ